MAEKKNPKDFINYLIEVIGKASGIYEDIFKDLIHIGMELSGFSVAKDSQKISIDKRLSRLDEARDALSDTLAAMSELRSEIEEGKQEHQRVLLELSHALTSRETAESKLDSVKRILEADTDILREVTAPRNLVRQHTIGFFLGILASLVAAGVIYAASAAFSNTSEKVNATSSLSSANSHMYQDHQRNFGGR